LQILASLRTGFSIAATPIATTTTTHPNSAAYADDNANADDDDDDGPPVLHPIPIPRPRKFYIARLDELVARHFRATQSASLAVSGRHLELLYVLVATLIAPPHGKAVSIVDFDGRFEPLRLLATAPAIAAPTGVAQGRDAPTATTGPNRLSRADLDHVYILHPPRGDAAHVAGCVASVEEYMVYSKHKSRAREWWGTVVIGGGLNPAGAGGGGQVAVVADWRGWLRVERAEVPPFRDMGVEDAMLDLEERQRAVDEAGWVASSPWGSMVFGR